MSVRFDRTNQSLNGADAAFDELVEQVGELVETGRDGDIQTLIDEHPQYADRIRSLLPAIEAMAAVEDLPGELVPRAEQPKRQLGDYRMIREIGRGGMGIVYEAEQKSLGRRVALKVLPLAATLNPQQLDRFKNEARAAATLKHPHIVGVYSVGVERGVHFYAMELVEGSSLAEVIAELRAAEQPAATAERSRDEAQIETAAQLSTVRTTEPRKFHRRAARLIADAADALDYAHNRGVLHRDVKPGNLLVDRQGHIWVADFGLARLESDAGVTLTGDILGTLRYMSPEQATGKPASVDHRTDIHALGATLFEMLTLRPAFAGDDRAELLRTIAAETPPSLRKLDPAIPADLDTIVAKALEKDAADRYQSAAELAADLRAFAEDRSITARPPSLAVRAQRWVRRHAAAAAAALLVSVLVVTALVGGLAAVNRLRGETAAALDDSQQSLQFAREAVDSMYAQLVTEWLSDDLELTPGKREFLEKAHRIYQQLADDAADDPASQWEAATAYSRVGQIQHKLGQYRQAKAAYSLAIDMYNDLLPALPQGPDRLAQLADVYRHAGRLHLDREELAAASTAWDAAHRLLAPLVDRHASDPDFQAALAANQLDRAGLLVRAGRLDDAERLARQAEADFAALQTHNTPSPQGQLGQQRSRVLLARILRTTDRFADAERVARTAARESARLMDEAHDWPQLQQVRIAGLLEWADTLAEQDQIDAAADVLQRARDAALASFPRDVTPNRLMTETIARRADWTRYAEPEAFRQFVDIEIRRGRVLAQLDQHYAAQQTLADAVRTAYVLKAGLRPARFAISEANARAALAELLAAADHPEAAPMAASAARTWHHLLQSAPDAASYSSGLYAVGDLDGFLAAFPQQQSTVEAPGPMTQPETFNEDLTVMAVANGVSWYRAESPADALLLLEGIADADSGADSYGWYYLAMAYCQLGKQDEAAAMFQQAVDWQQANAPDSAELAALRDEAAALLASDVQANRPDFQPPAAR